MGVMWPEAKEAGNSQKLEEARNGFSPKASGVGGPADTLILDFWPRDLRENKNLFSQQLAASKPVLICYSSPRKLIHAEAGRSSQGLGQGGP